MSTPDLRPTTPCRGSRAASSSRRRSVAAIALALGLGPLAVAGCTDSSGSSSATSSGAGTGGVLTVQGGSKPQYQENFNPFSPDVNVGTKGLVYEPLMLASPASSKPMPWLADSLTWGQDGKSATFQIHDGITWNDGKPFTAQDVAFSFNLLTKYPAMNTAAIPVTGATAAGNTATVTFSKTAYVYEATIDNFTPLPEHVWSSQDPTKWTNPKPVGTGPFVLGQVSAQLLSYTANPSYWQKGKVKVGQVNYPSSTAQTINNTLASGKLDWAGAFVANIDDVFVSKDKEHNKYWLPGDGLVNLVVNLKKAPFDDVTVRQALSLAVDRDALSKTAESGLEPPANPTGLVMPLFKDYLAPSYANAKFSLSLDQANAKLDAAGYTRGADGVRVTPSGQRMAYTLVIPSSYPDWVTMSKLLQDQLSKIGITVNPQGVAFQAYSDGLHNGQYDVTISSVAAGSTPCNLYNSMLSKDLSAPIGQKAKTNNERWEDQATEDLLTAYRNTEDKSAQTQAAQGLQKVMVEQLPVIPMLQSTNWYEYRTARWTGWPDESNPYALPSPSQFPDNLLVLTHLQPAS